MRTKSVRNVHNQQTIQIATFGKDFNGIINGIRNFPTDKLVLLHYQEDENDAKEFSYGISHAFNILVSLRMISKPDVIRNGIEVVTEIVKTAKTARILMNISAGDKAITCASLISAFVNGVVAYGFQSDDKPLVFPILKLHFVETISDEKIKILKTLYQHGGAIGNLGLLARITKLKKSLLSYHLHGSNKSRRGLIQRGLVDVKNLEKGQVGIILTTYGKLAVHSNPLIYEFVKN